MFTEKAFGTTVNSLLFFHSVFVVVVVGCWLLVVCRSLFVVRCSLFVVRCSLFVV